MLSIIQPHRHAIETISTLVRQKSIVKRTTSFILDETEAITESSVDLLTDSDHTDIRLLEAAGLRVVERVEEAEEAEHAEDDADDGVILNTSLDRLLTKQIPKFHRRELQLSSKLIGKGAFSEVYGVQGINIMKNVATNTCSKEEQASRAMFTNAFMSKEGPDKDDQDSPPLKLAVKHLSRKLLRHPKHFYQAALDLSREAYIMSQLDHPHILKVRATTMGGASAFSETGRYDGFFIVTDFLSETLEQRMQKWKRCWVYQAMEDLPKMIMKTQYANQLASALGYLHDRRIIFRDLKPDNIGFLHHSPHTLQLFDFGICRILPRPTKSSLHSNSSTDSIAPLPEEEETHLMSLAGTTRYMASEIMTTGRYNLKADVHSFGMVVWEMYAEKKPFPTLGHENFYDFVCRCKIRPPVAHLHLPEALEKLIVGSWCPSLKHRLSMKDINEVLPDILREMEDQMMPNVLEC